MLAKKLFAKLIPPNRLETAEAKNVQTKKGWTKKAAADPEDDEGHIEHAQEGGLLDPALPGLEGPLNDTSPIRGSKPAVPLIKEAVAVEGASKQIPEDSTAGGNRKERETTRFFGKEPKSRGRTNSARKAKISQEPKSWGRTSSARKARRRDHGRHRKGLCCDDPRGLKDDPAAEERDCKEQITGTDDYAEKECLGLGNGCQRSVCKTRRNR